eukprot:8740222-Pyramimonas_sp.AAC.1
MDDAGFQWTGPDPRQAETLFSAVRYFTGRAYEPGLISQASKSGCVTTNAATKRVITPFVRGLRINMYAHRRNFGHDLSDTRTKRVIERKRFAGLAARKRRLRALARGGSYKVRTLCRTGLLPAAAHGAG